MIKSITQSEITFMVEELRILATGYGKFDRYLTDDSNPSNKVAKAFANQYLEGDGDKLPVRGFHTVVPVVWDKAWQTIKNKVDEVQPDVLICMGAAGATMFERIARNEAYNIADAEGKFFEKPYVVNTPQDKSLLEQNSGNQFNNYPPLATYADGTPTPYTFPSTLAFDYLEEKMNNTSNPNILKVRNISFNAGGYLCNFAFYMPALLLREKVAFTGFLHIEGDRKDEEYKETGEFIFNEYAKWLQRNYIKVSRSELK